MHKIIPTQIILFLHPQKIMASVFKPQTPEQTQKRYRK